MFMYVKRAQSCSLWKGLCSFLISSAKELIDSAIQCIVHLNAFCSINVLCGLACYLDVIKLQN